MIQDHWEDTVYHVEGQPYNGMPVFRITPVMGGKVRAVHQNLLLLFGGNIDGDSEDKESQQEVDDPQDSISADSNDKESEAEVVSLDPKPVGDGDAICVQHIQIGEKPDYWTQSIWGWMKSLYGCQ